MGIITAEVFYPHYDIATNMISDLGSSRPPNSVVVEPSARIFDTSMMMAGIMIIVGAWFLKHKKEMRYSTLLMGIGTLGVGLFPAYHHIPHLISAGLAFFVGGIAAALSSRGMESPFKHIVAILGFTSLIFLFVGVVTPNFIVPELGEGGSERWVAYPLVLWLVGYGGYLMGRAKK